MNFKEVNMYYHYPCPYCKSPCSFVQRDNDSISFHISSLFIKLEWFCPTCKTTFTKKHKYKLIME